MLDPLQFDRLVCAIAHTTIEMVGMLNCAHQSKFYFNFEALTMGLSDARKEWKHNLHKAEVLWSMSEMR